MRKISFIIPCYNIENYVSFCLDSVLNQDVKDFEIICINDGSTDNTEKILRQYEKLDSRIKILTQEQKGQGAARNLGIDAADGDYIHFLDGDDVIAPIMAKKTLELAQKVDTDIVFFSYLMYNMDTGYYTTHFKPEHNDRENTLILQKDLLDSEILRAGTTTCYRLYKSEFLKNNNIRFIENLTYEDAPFSIEALCKANRTSFTNLPLYIYRINRPGSIMTSQTQFKYMDSIKSLNFRDNILKDFNIYDRFKGIYLHLDLSFLFLTYNKLDIQHKKLFYETIKEYLTNIDFNKFTTYQQNYAQQYQQVKLILNNSFEDFNKGL